MAARKKELTCVYLGSQKLVSLDAGGVHPDAKMDFRGQAITSLVKMNFVFRNTGSAAIKAEDVKEPIGLYFPEDVKLLNTFVEKTGPSEFRFEVLILPDQRVVTCQFLLLNSGDEAYLSVYVYNSEPRRPQLKGRIVDLQKLVIVDESNTQTANPFPLTSSRGVRKILYWALLVFNGVLSLIFLGLVIGGSVSYAGYRSWAREWKEPYDKTVKEVNAEPEAKRELSELSKEQSQLVPVIHMDMHESFLSDVPFHRIAMLQQRLKDKGIPKKPNAMFSSWTEYLGATLVFFVFFTLFASTVVFIYLSPRGY